MSLNQRAATLRSELFLLQNKFCDLGQAAKNVGQHEAGKQIDDAMYSLRNLLATLGEVFSDANCDPKDQMYAINLDSEFE